MVGGAVSIDDGVYMEGSESRSFSSSTKHRAWLFRFSEILLLDDGPPAANRALLPEADGELTDEPARCEPARRRMLSSLLPRLRLWSGICYRGSRI